MSEKIFAEGFSFSKRDEAPDFVIGRVAVKVADALAWLKSNESNGWVNMDIKKSKGGKYYMELDTWKPSPKAETKTEEVKEDLPF